MRNIHVRIRAALFLFAVGGLSPLSVFAQEIPGGDSPFGVREPIIPEASPPPPPPPPPGPGDAMVFTETAQVKRRYTLEFTPTGVAADGLNAYGADLSVSTDALLRDRAVRLRGGYRHMDFASADDRNRWILNARLPLTRTIPGRRTGAALSGEYTHTSVAGSKYKLSASVDYRLLEPVSVGVTPFFVADEATEDVGLSGSATYLFSEASRIDLAYRLPNDVEVDRDYSLTFNRRLLVRNGVTTRLIAGVARDWALLATLSISR